MNKIIDNFRALRRAAFGLAALPVIVATAVAQNYLLRPIFGNRTATTSLVGRVLTRMLGMKVVFNAASAPPVQGRPVWYVANHVTGADGAAVWRRLEGAPVGHERVGKSLGLRSLARAMNFVGVRQRKEYNDVSRGRLIENFNKGLNAVMFPEGHVNKGGPLFMFHAGLFSLLYGDKGTDSKGRTVALEKDVVVQPVAIRLIEANGRNALAEPALQRDFYAMPQHDNDLKRAWQRLKVKRLTVELTLLPALEPAAFDNHRDLVNRAAQDIAAVVSPGQAVFSKAMLKPR